MADPMLNSHVLSTGGSHSSLPQPRARMSASSLPSVDGAFTKRFGLGPRRIIGRGVLKNTSQASLKAAIQTIQESANTTPGTYIDVDGAEYANCILLTYDQASDIQREASDSYWCRVQWQILKQSPIL